MDEATPQASSAREYLTAAAALADEFGWRAKWFERDDEVVMVAQISIDAAFGRFVWAFDTTIAALRCMVASSKTIPAGNQQAILELCARVNQGLPFGCMEYAFDEHVVVFRDSVDLDYGPLELLVERTTARVLNLGRRYARALEATLQGTEPADAVLLAESQT